MGECTESLHIRGPVRNQGEWEMNRSKAKVLMAVCYGLNRDIDRYSVPISAVYWPSLFEVLPHQIQGGADSPEGVETRRSGVSVYRHLQ